MATFLIAHGAWSGGWSWKKLRPEMAARGHTILTPTYTGLGERAHLARADLGLSDHVADMLGVIEAEELSGFILVGHSYGGLVATGVAMLVPDKVGALVYLDAFVPEAGESVFTFRLPFVLAGLLGLWLCFPVARALVGARAAWLATLLLAVHPMHVFYSRFARAYSIVFLAMDVTAILDQLGIERAHVVGHDWGAATAWATAAFAPERVDHLVALSVGHPTSFATAGFEQRQKSWYMLLFQFAPQAENWLEADEGANFRAFTAHPDFDAVFAEVRANRSLTPALNYYRANVGPDALTGPPVDLPPIQSPAMGVWSSGDFALTEQQMTGSTAFCTAGFRYERVSGACHWLQWEAPGTVNELLVDFLPR